MNPQLRSLTVAQVILLASFIVICVVGIATSAAQSPAHEREIEYKMAAHLPLKVELKNAEKVKDLANEDWLSDLELEVTNTGSKPIYLVYFSLALEDVKDWDGVGIGYQLIYGRPELGDIKTLATPDDVPIRAGESAVIKARPGGAKSWKMFKKERGFADPKKLSLSFQILSFGDGTGYVGPHGSFKPDKRKAFL